MTAPRQDATVLVNFCYLLPCSREGQALVTSSCTLYRTPLDRDDRMVRYRRYRNTARYCRTDSSHGNNTVAQGAVGTRVLFMYMFIYRKKVSLHARECPTPVDTQSQENRRACFTAWNRQRQHLIKSDVVHGTNAEHQSLSYLHGTKVINVRSHSPRLDIFEQCSYRRGGKRKRTSLCCRCCYCCHTAFESLKTT